MTKREEFNLLTIEVNKLKDVTVNAISRDETIDRLQILQSEIKASLKERPTINYLK